MRAGRLKRAGALSDGCRYGGSCASIENGTLAHDGGTGETEVICLPLGGRPAAGRALERGWLVGVDRRELELRWDIPALPSELLRAIAKQGGGSVVLVLGAGCSVESPTNLRTARDLAIHCHRQLLLNGVLEDGEVDNPSDLSSVADAVFQEG